ncbi:MAG: hypothetical protein HC795_12145 [Coleofasciculaceae cyanobacterium RL_1_1]|nr:hypothetical protein [Coleofasciculaceae cyanobacterium RL_1_1]
MSATKTYSTRKFIEPAIFLRWFTFGLISVALVASWFMGQTQIRKTVAVESDAEDYTEVGPLTLNPRAIGATRIKAVANIPSNHWVTYELILLDSQGNIVTSAMKEAWSESGTWNEDGESGTWSETDLDAGLDVKVQASETLTLAVSVLDYTATSGQEITTPVPIEVTAHTGIVYQTPLWWGWIVTAVLTWMSGYMIQTGSGRKAIFKTIPDSDVGARGTLGGSLSLVHLWLEITSDETTPPTLKPKLWIRNADGEDIFRYTYTVTPRSAGEDVRKSELNVYFRLREKGSYGFYVEVMPDASVDRTTITVFDGAKTAGRVEVTDIDNVAIDMLDDLENDSDASLTGFTQKSDF